MTPLEVKGSVVVVQGQCIDVGARVLDAQVSRDIVLVLIDPDWYITAEYRRQRRAGMPPVRNLRAYSTDGTLLWEADLPEEADYYHEIVSTEPIEVHSFSCFRCRIDSRTGRIISKAFTK